ncbi:hypothetical protein [Microbacterium aurantiacum]|uniref:YfhO family protein n=1 Tax=Microbacterium aurantiacum TaxID=162393 RepID=A0ABT8FXS7_9MICO|nr:hypothetical protein [Microbacterium aurantiacum]MDN4465682.1 hypothetical protein [Microbacterium aurantiacum]
MIVLAATPLAFDRHHYFVDDSVNGAFGQWYHLGSSLLVGRVPLLEPSVWSSGNLMAEGQWGFFNPVILAISVLAALTGDAAVFTTIVKMVAILVGAAGVYVLVRALGGRPAFAFVAGTAAPFAGFTTYFDAPSWVTGLFAWSLFPWFWAALTRVRNHRGGPLGAFIAGYLLISIGYVHGTIALVIVMGTSLLLASVRRDWGGAARIAMLGSLLAMVAIGVHLTSVLTAAVTNRSGSAIYMDQFMTLDLSGLLMSPISTALPQVAAWWWPGFTAPVPMAYISWVLPLAAIVSWRRLMRVNRSAADVLITGVFFLAFIMLPTVIGPLRYPTRMLPYVALCAVVLLAIGLDRARVVSRTRVLLAVGLLSTSFYLAWAQQPQFARRIVAAALLGLIGITLLLIVWKRFAGHRERQSVGVAITFAAVTFATFGIQQYAYPRPVWDSQQVPTSIAELQVQLSKAEGDTIVVGNPLAIEPSPELWRETLFANSWYVNPESVVNRYQLLGFQGFNSTLCLGYLGETCPELAERLFETRDDTNLQLADELSIDSVQVIKSTETARYLDSPPEGWSVADDGTFTQLWTRDEPVGRAGGIVDITPGLVVTDVVTSKEEVSMKVESTPEAGGTITFSRLAWPGYHASGATIGEVADGFLLTVDVPAGTTGAVTVRFVPAGLPAALGLLITALTGSVIWAAVAWRHRRRNNARAIEPPAEPAV